MAFGGSGAGLIPGLTTAPIYRPDLTVLVPLLYGGTASLRPAGGPGPIEAQIEVPLRVPPTAIAAVGR
jgi:hypothetical protein